MRFCYFYSFLFFLKYYYLGSIYNNFNLVNVLLFFIMCFCNFNFFDIS